ncbi:MAG: hypothetical protein ACRDMH_16440 [Solirubrobacterales bacterium]
MAARRGAHNAGQSTVEWLGLVLMVAIAALAVLGLVARGLSVVGLAQAIATRLVCATDLSDACSAPGPLIAAYGPELAARVEENAPEIDYEDGMSDVPVDFRSCRGGPCGEGPDAGAVRASGTGEPAAAFVHVVDCGDPGPATPGARRRYDCSGDRAGNVYVQYWLYYGDSSTAPWSDLPGSPGSHRDDWEGYQVRIGPAETDARATSHHGYDYRGGAVNWPSDVGIVSKAAWGESTGHLYVSDGSHAGHVYEPPRTVPLRDARTTTRAAAEVTAAARRLPIGAHAEISLTAPPRSTRWTPASDLVLIPIESLGPEARHTLFAIVPPWRKPVYSDPEDQGT